MKKLIDEVADKNILTFKLISYFNSFPYLINQ